jgi:hypothetical protein
MFWTVNGHEARLTSSMIAAASGGNSLAINAIINSAETMLTSIVI